MAKRTKATALEAAARGAYAEWRRWHGATSAGVTLSPWLDLTENRRGLWRRIARAARRVAAA